MKASPKEVKALRFPVGKHKALRVRTILTGRYSPVELKLDRYKIS